MGCPKCKSDRLKGAAIPGISLVLSPLVHRRRYHCADCGWTGWKHRLQRRGEASMTVALRQRDGPDARALWFFIAVVAFVLLTTVMLVRSCGSAAPSESVRSLN
jgi:hypothetical protein